jgi:uncharacterized protein
MGGIAYIDSSALLKLVVREEETSALEAHLSARDGLITSRLALLECRRAARRLPHRRLLQTVDAVFEAVHLLEITPFILDTAAALPPPRLRSLDAIHVATALSVGDSGLEVLAYDTGCADAARASGLSVVQPGR